MEGLDKPRQFLATALAALAGYVDAVGFLSADRYFVSFMSGNTTRFATDLVTHGAKGLIPAALIGGFVVGVGAGHVVVDKAGRWRKPAVLGLVTALLVLACIAILARQTSLMMALMVLAMGALNNTLQRDESPVALTYLTGALVRIGLALGGLITGRSQPAIGAYLAMWLALSGGAAFGAWGFLLVGSKCLLLAAVSAAILTVAGYRISRS